MTRRAASWVGGALVALGIMGLFGRGLFLGSGSPPGYLSVPMTPGGMMGSGYGAGRLVNHAGLAAAVRQGTLGATIDHQTNTVTYAGGAVLLVALASPHGQPNMTWEIDGLVNPTVVVRPGARVTVDLVNTDWGYMHGFELTATPPPYPFMAMMGIANNFLLMPLPERTAKDLATAQYYTSTRSFTAVRGTYYYLCPVPGHAQQGMYGKLVIS